MTDLELADVGLAAMRRATDRQGAQRNRKPTIMDYVQMWLAIGAIVGTTIAGFVVN